MRKIKKNDDVIVITGKDKGKRGKVLRIEDSNYIVVQGINLVKKHQKPNPAKGNAGGIIEQESPIHISNVSIYNFESKRADRVGFKIRDEDQKVRVFKSSGDLIES